MSALPAAKGRTSQMPGAADLPGQHDYPESSRPLDQSELPRLQQRLGNLPDGHPSSLRDEDGSWRAPALSLKDLELPIEDTPTDTETPDATSDAWRDGLPALEAAWERHLERWPETERPAVDRSNDEAGSWRGDGGQYLNTEENIVTGHARDRIIEAAPEVTDALQAVEGTVPGVRLVGLDRCIKGEDRFKEKVAEGLALKPERSVENETGSIPDALRFTYQFSSETYARDHGVVCDKLQEHGFEPVLSRNSWESPDYKGVNSRWRTTEGQLFEVQFHTRDSFEAKEITHQAYERLRNPTTDRAEMGELKQYQRLVASQVKVPENVLGISNFDKRSS
jgi:hypothetical protein